MIKVTTTASSDDNTTALAPSIKRLNIYNIRIKETKYLNDFFGGEQRF